MPGAGMIPKSANMPPFGGVRVLNWNLGRRRTQALANLAVLLALAGCGDAGRSGSGANVSKVEEAGPASSEKSALAGKYDRVFQGSVYFRVPDGYRGAETRNGIVLARDADLKTGSPKGFLLMSPLLTLDAGLKAELEKKGPENMALAIAIALGGLADDPDARYATPQLANDPAKDGYSVYRLASTSKEKGSGRPLVQQFAVILFGDRLLAVVAKGFDTTENAQLLEPGFLTFVQSIEFPSNGAPPPASSAKEKLASSLEALFPKPKASGGGGGGGNCRTVTRQMCSGGIGTSMGYFCNTYPQRVCS